MAQDQLLTGHSKNRIDRNDIAWQSNRVDLSPLQSSAARLFYAFHFIQWNVQFCFPYTRKTVCQFTSSSTGCIDLARVSVINDFPMRDIFCCHLSKFLKEDNSQCEIPHRQHSTIDF